MVFTASGIGVGVAAARAADPARRGRRRPGAAQVTAPVALLSRLASRGAAAGPAGRAGRGRRRDGRQTRRYGAELTADFRELDQRIVGRRGLGGDRRRPALGGRGGRKRGRAQERGDDLRPSGQRAGCVVRPRFLGHSRRRRSRPTQDMLTATATREPSLLGPRLGHEQALRPLEQAGAGRGVADSAAGGAPADSARRRLSRPTLSRRRARDQRRDERLGGGTLGDRSDADAALGAA